MRTVIVAALLGSALVAAPALLATQESRATDSLERAFAANGRIRMDLSAGEYRISGSSDNRIRLDWSVANADQLSRVKARAEVHGSDATITTDGPSNHFKVSIQVPTRSDLYVRLTAGDLSVQHVEGNKDIELHAGDIKIDVGRAEDYHSVDATVWAGDLNAAPFQVSKEGLFRSFDWKGHGPYRLHVHLKAGDIRLFSKSADGR
jgi:hypothetical protein